MYVMYTSQCTVAVFNPTLMGYLNTLRGPSKFHVWCPNMTNDTSLESSYMLCFKNLKKKIANFFFGKIRLWSKMFAKKIYQNWENIHFWIVLDHATFKYAKKFCKIFNKLICYQEKLKKRKFLLTGCMQIICKTFLWNLNNLFPNVIGIPKS